MPDEREQAGERGGDRGRLALLRLPGEMVFGSDGGHEAVNRSRGGYRRRAASRETRSPAASRRSRNGAARRIAPSIRRRVASWLGLRTAMAESLGPVACMGMEGFGFFQDPDFQKRLQEMAEQMQATQ